MKFDDIMEQDVLPRDRSTMGAEGIAQQLIQAARQKAYQSGNADDSEAVRSNALSLASRFLSTIEDAINRELRTRVIGGGRKL
jgi:hypothetical protein